MITDSGLYHEILPDGRHAATAEAESRCDTYDEAKAEAVAEVDRLSSGCAAAQREGRKQCVSRLVTEHVYSSPRRVTASARWEDAQS